MSQQSFMLKHFPNRVVVYCGISFDPLPSYVNKLSQSFEAIQSRSGAKMWLSSPERYFIRNIEKRYVLSFEFNRFGYVGIDLSTWAAEMNEISKLFQLGLNTMGIEKVARIGFKTTAYVPMEMTHPEICDLMFGTFLQGTNVFEPMCGTPDDVLIQVHGTQKGLKTQTVLAAMTADQVAQQVMSNANLELLLEPRLYDTTLKDFRDRVAQDCLSIDNDVSRLNCTPDSISEFTKLSLEVTDLIAETSVNRLKHLRKKG